MKATAILVWGIVYTEEERERMPRGIARMAEEWTEREREKARGLVRGSEAGPLTQAMAVQKREKWDDARQRTPLLGEYGDGKDPLFFACPGARALVRVGQTESTEVETPDAPADWRTDLEAFCKALGLPWRTPGWCMVARLTE